MFKHPSGNIPRQGSATPRAPLIMAMPDQPSDNQAINAQALSLPDQLKAALSLPGIDPARFAAVTQAFRPLPIHGQVELAHRLIGARGQYLAHRMWECDSESAQGVRRKRLKDIGKAAGRLLQLLHRNKTDPQPWNLHPAATLALPELCRAASEGQRSPETWDPPRGLNLLGAMLSDLSKVGAQAEIIFPSRFPKERGGSRREGPTPVTGLVERLVDIYGEMRAQYPKSGPAPAFDASLKEFVRAALRFLVSAPPEFTDYNGQRYRLLDANFLQTDLPETSRITDDAIREIFARRRSQSKPKKQLI
jgi:hypothetical protein